MRRWLRKIIALFNARSETFTVRRVAWNGRPLNEEAVVAGKPGASEYGTLTAGLAVDYCDLAPAPSTSTSAPAVN